MDNSKYYGGRDIYGRLLPVDTAVGQLEPESIILLDDIDSEYCALIETLDRKDGTA